MPRENNPNILLKTRKLPAKLEEPLLPFQQTLPLPFPLAKSPLLISTEPQFHPETPLSEPPLQPSAKISEWNPADEVKLSELHNQLGNRWSLISQNFEGKTDNCVKNHFFSRLRMSLRHLNKELPPQTSIKPVKMHVLYKIMSTCQERFNPDSEYTQQFIDFSYQLKNKLLNFVIQKDPFTVADVQKTIENMHIFNKKFKMRADILKVPKTSRVSKQKKAIQTNLRMQDQPNPSLQFPAIQIQNNEIPTQREGWNSIQSILQESWRFSEALQLKNERVEIKMIDTSEYLFNEDEAFNKCWPYFDEAFVRNAWDQPPF